MGVHLDYGMVQITGGLPLWTTYLHYMWHNTIVILTVIYQFGIIHYVPVSQVSWRRGGGMDSGRNKACLKRATCCRRTCLFFLFLLIFFFCLRSQFCSDLKQSILATVIKIYKTVLLFNIIIAFL